MGELRAVISPTTQFSFLSARKTRKVIKLWNEIFQKMFFFTVYLGEQNYKNDDKLVSVQVRWSYNK